MNSPGALALLNTVENGLHPRLTDPLNGLVRDKDIAVNFPKDPPPLYGNHLALAIKRDWAEVDEGRTFVHGWIDRAVEEIRRRLTAAESLRYNTKIGVGEDPALDLYFVYLTLSY